MRFLNKLFIVITFVFISQISLAQKPRKPILMVYGGEPEAFAAAMQSAKSDVPTVWVLGEANGFSTLIKAALYQKGNLTVNKSPLDGGLWKDFVQKLRVDTLDSMSYVLDLSKSSVILAQMARAQKNLTIIENTAIKKIAKKKSGWEVELVDKSKYDLRVFVDGGVDEKLRSVVPNVEARLVDSLRSVQRLSAAELRTVVALANDKAYLMADVLKAQQDNYFSLAILRDYSADFANVSIRMNIGQAIGASAAYCAFFKAQADKIEVRKLQMELLNFGVRLSSWKDITAKDPNVAILQKMYLTSILGAAKQGTSLELDKTDSVKVDAVKSIFNQYYSRAQLWYLDNKVEYFKLKDAISFIKMIAFRSDEIDKEIRGRWKSSFHFENEYDLNRTISRYEFAVLVGYYADPFPKMVNHQGGILR